MDRVSGNDFVDVGSTYLKNGTKDVGSTLWVILPNTKVIIDSEIEAIATEVILSPAHRGNLSLQYVCQWWVDGTLKSAQIDERRIEVDMQRVKSSTSKYIGLKHD